MTIPNLPTDNLYKFLALSGVALTLFSIYYQLSPIEKIVSETQVVEIEIAILGFKIQANHEQVELMQEIVDNTIARQKGTYEASPDVIQLFYSEDEVKALLVQMKKSLLENEIDNAKVKASRDRLVYLIRRQDSAGTNATIMRVVASLLLTVGFVLWYLKVQRPLDLLLQDDVNARKSNVSKQA